MYHGETAISYARVSREEQTKGYSIAAQLEDNRRYAKQVGLTITIETSDDETGTRLEREQFSDILARLRRGEVKHLIVWVVDRLSREPEHFFALRRELQKLGVTVHYSRQGRASTAESDDEFIEDVESIIAKREIRNFQKRSLAGRWQKAMSGYVPGNSTPPFGYRRAGERRQSTYAVNDEEAAIVRQIYHWYTADRISPTEIARRLSKSKIATPGDRKHSVKKKTDYGVWHPSAIYKILHDESYAGTAWVRTRTRVDGHWTKQDEEKHIPVPVPSIIPRDAWEVAKARLATGRQRSIRNTQYGDLMGRRLRCRCSKAIHHIRRNNGYKVYDYYECSSRSLALGACGLPSFRVDKVDMLAWGFVTDLLTRPDTLFAEQQAREHDHVAEQEARHHERAKVEEDINQAQRQLAWTLEALSKTQSDDERTILETQRRAHLQTLKDLRIQLRVFDTLPLLPPSVDTLIASLHVYREHAGAVLTDQSLPKEEQRGFIDDLDITGILSVVDGRKRISFQWESLTVDKWLDNAL
jgi:site-specific DNA recombinase